MDEYSIRIVSPFSKYFRESLSIILPYEGALSKIWTRSTQDTKMIIMEGNSDCSSDHVIGGKDPCTLFNHPKLFFICGNEDTNGGIIAEFERRVTDCPGESNFVARTKVWIRTWKIIIIGDYFGTREKQRKINSKNRIGRLGRYHRAENVLEVEVEFGSETERAYSDRSSVRTHSGKCQGGPRWTVVDNGDGEQKIADCDR